MLKRRLVKDDERYRLTDFSIPELDPLTFSMTELKTGQSTRGHKHPWPEVYFFYDSAFLTLDDDQFHVHDGQIVLVKPDQFHKVQAIGESKCMFASAFWGQRDESKATY